MQDTSLSILEWEGVYKAAIEFRRIEPWQWMEDTDLFGVRNPENGEIGYCCVVGSLGEFFGLIVNLGREGLDVYLKTQAGEVSPQDDDVIYQNKALVASFGDRRSLQKPDLDVVKRLGLKFKGATSWPSFQSHQPGYYPWYLNRKEVLFLTLCLQQATAVALRFKTNKNLFRSSRKNHFFVRVAEKQGGQLTWRDEWLPPSPPLEPEIETPILDELRLQRIKKNAFQSNEIWEVDSFHVPVPIKEGKKPFYPRVLLVVDQNSGIVLVSHLEDPERYRAEFQNQMLKLIENLKAVPREMMIRDRELFRLLDPIASKMGFALTAVKRFKELGKARKHLEAALLSGKVM